MPGKVLVTGGIGDDYLVGGDRNTGDTYLYGGTGRDHIRTDFYHEELTNARNQGNEYLYGDYKYGADSLDKDLIGDADIIVGGPSFRNSEKVQKIHGGDGDDQLTAGDDWLESYLYGENDDDTLQVPQNIGDTLLVHGGDGNDTWLIDDFSTITTGRRGNQNANEYGFGGAGDDIVRGTHRTTTLQILYGGDDEDKVYGGDSTDFNLLVGNAGDDWIEGGDLTGD